MATRRVTIRMDDKILKHFQYREVRGYQTRINDALEEYIENSTNTVPELERALIEQQILNKALLDYIRKLDKDNKNKLVFDQKDKNLITAVLNNSWS